MPSFFASIVPFGSNKLPTRTRVLVILENCLIVAFFILKDPLCKNNILIHFFLIDLMAEFKKCFSMTFFILKDPLNENSIFLHFPFPYLLFYRKINVTQVYFLLCV